MGSTRLATLLRQLSLHPGSGGIAALLRQSPVGPASSRLSGEGSERTLYSLRACFHTDAREASIREFTSISRLSSTGPVRDFSEGRDSERDGNEYRRWVEERLQSTRDSGAQQAADGNIQLAEENAARGEEATSSGLQERDPEVADALSEATAQAASEASEGAAPAADAIEATAAEAEAPSDLKDALGATPGQPDDAKEAPSEAPSIVGSSGTVSSSAPAPRRVTVREAAAALPDAVLGYRELGVSTSSGDAAFLQDGQGRINRRRLFWPSQAYTVEDLVARSQDGKGLAQRRQQVGLPVKKATNAEALKAADFRNQAFLHKFTSEAGQLPPRRVTRLQKKVHVHVMKQIKIARQMALLPPEGKMAELMPRAGGKR